MWTILRVLLYSLVASLIAYSVAQVVINQDQEPVQAWKQFPSPAVGASGILNYDYGVGTIDTEKVFVLGKDAIVYDCNGARGSCNVFDSSRVPSISDKCVDRWPMPDPPEEPVSQITYFRCVVDASLQISFAVQGDGSIWWWHDY